MTSCAEVVAAPCVNDAAGRLVPTDYWWIGFCVAMVIIAIVFAIGIDEWGRKK